MIKKKDNVFHIDTCNTSYIFAVMPGGQLQNLYYGKRIRSTSDYSPLFEKYPIGYGNTVSYSQEDTGCSLDNICLEYSAGGKGDYRLSPIQLVMPDGSYTCDFIYKSYEIIDGVQPIKGLPHAVENGEKVHTLKIELTDKLFDVSLLLYYTCFEKYDTIVRKAQLLNNSEADIFINKMMSFNLDLPERDYSLLTFDGLWVRERCKNERELTSGIIVNQSTTGASSNRHNPFIILKKRNADEFKGNCFGFNLVYSGNHYEAIETTEYNKVRIMSGICPEYFNWQLKSGETFSTPEAVLSFSSNGLNGLSTNMHNFIKKHIIRGEWAHKERPILINNWEATYFDFNEGKLMKLAKEAAKLGIELFVLDDGWFGERNNDTSSLGDWTVNERKLPHSLNGLAKKINDLGMMFGLWFEPEMVNENSNLYRQHPDWTIKVPGRVPSLGRNQLVLDLTRQEVRDYIVQAVCSVLDSANIEYVKWDMNRHISDAYSNNLGKNQGEFYHRYILGLYDILNRICSKYPHILFESCSSGGNRFDLGMLCYMPQVWTSDDSDAVERLKIQSGTSYGYPLCTMGAHVSASPNHQTLRTTPIETRFNVAAFGVLGYELDLTMVSQAELKAIGQQIEFYKQYRRLLQFGQFYRLEDVDSRLSSWMVISEDKKRALIGTYQTLAQPNPSPDILKGAYLEDVVQYTVKVRKQYMSIKAFGNLINHITPVKIKADGVIHTIASNHYMMQTEDEQYVAYGDLINNAGIKLNQQFSGIGYNDKVRVMGDFGSRIYCIDAGDNKLLSDE